MTELFVLPFYPTIMLAVLLFLAILRMVRERRGGDNTFLDEILPIALIGSGAWLGWSTMQGFDHWGMSLAGGIVGAALTMLVFGLLTWMSQED